MDERWLNTMLTLVEEPPKWRNVALLVDELVPAQDAVTLPALVRELTDIQRHVLARVAVHSWTHQGALLYHPPTPQQRQAAFSLAAPQLGLVVALVSRANRFFFRLTRRGDAVARQVVNALPSAVAERDEITFNQLCVLMRNQQEIGASEAYRTPASSRLRPSLRIVR